MLDLRKIYNKIITQAKVKDEKQKLVTPDGVKKTTKSGKAATQAQTKTAPKPKSPKTTSKADSKAEASAGVTINQQFHLGNGDGSGKKGGSKKAGNEKTATAKKKGTGKTDPNTVKKAILALGWAKLNDKEKAIMSKFKPHIQSLFEK